MQITRLTNVVVVLFLSIVAMTLEANLTRFADCISYYSNEDYTYNIEQGVIAVFPENDRVIDRRGVDSVVFRCAQMIGAPGCFYLRQNSHPAYTPVQALTGVQLLEQTIEGVISLVEDPRTNTNNRTGTLESRRDTAYYGFGGFSTEQKH
ncbi:putative secreted protein [Wickerhamomyces ciferrii]|uniref:Secreted protein n=1 Tax=Wickerhamomyces ciferrii (strain ATCC 14091 / BCRC 22168 / CBS 111 / JCM 3599 / NBRC 0793 / NRRL Y-1031 F-60-10) TaxID=1206466 RepID=K0KWK9_WICCF|nr:uncharacterized protein BN7_5471 [Wickerhamomyces ciferrii]CCH45884.1 putative secreted protein [Wickerhamomyces ciferrii]